MNMMPAEAVNVRAAIKALPPLIKGYLRVGAYVGDGAVIDHQFGTPTYSSSCRSRPWKTRYFVHFGAPDEFTPAVAPEFAPLN